MARIILLSLSLLNVHVRFSLLSHDFSRVSLGNTFRHLSLSSNRVQLRNLFSQNVKVMSLKRLSRRLLDSQLVQHFLRRRNFLQDLFVGHVRKLRRLRVFQTRKFIRSFVFFVVVGSANRKGSGAFRLLGLSSKRSRRAQSRLVYVFSQRRRRRRRRTTGEYARVS